MPWASKVCSRARQVQLAVALAPKDLSAGCPDRGILVEREQYTGGQSVTLARPKRMVVLVACVVGNFVASPAQAADLREETVAAFDRYIQATESQMDEELRNGHFLVMDRWNRQSRDSVSAQLRRGEIYVEHLRTLDDGQLIWIPHGLVHDWVGMAFIPGATLPKTLAVLRDYDNHQNIYKPEVRQSKLLEQHGNTTKTYLQFYSKSIVTVVLNANFTVDFTQVTSTRAETRSHSTRIAELDHAGEPQERELPVGKDHGYLWRLDSYWRLEEADGGVYIQVESIGLSRGVPRILAWLVNPLIYNIARSVMSNLLTATRKAVIDRNHLSTGYATPALPHRPPAAVCATEPARVSSAAL